ncbi:MAG: hypothetical protein ACOH1T_06010 [Microbacteriaceae bacterium]
MTQLTTPGEAPGARLGVSAFVVALLPLIWILVVHVLVAVSIGSNDALGTIVIAVYFASFAVLPLFSLLAVVLAILALMVNGRRGKIMGGIALLLIGAEIIAIIILVGGSFDLPAQSLGA